MKNVVTVAMCFIIFCAAAVPVLAAGGKVQHEHEQGDTPGPGSDAQDNQAG